MAPIRVGIVGLSTNTSGSSWAKNTHLPYLNASPHYMITAVLNSSLQSSQSAVEAFGLEKAKPYEDIGSLASDPNVDLVVLCVEVKMHGPMVRAAIEHGKDIYCEWPLAQSYEEATELAALAAQKNIQTYVGLESRLSPPLVKLRELISSGAIGEVISTTVSATLGQPPKVWSERVQFYLNVHSGQSPLHTRVGHFLDAFCTLLGEFESLHPLLVTLQKEIKVYDVPVSQIAEAAKDSSTPYRTVQRTAPDDILLHGVLTNGAAASLHIRSGEKDADGNMLRWIITGSEGLIEVTQKAGQFVRDKSVQITLVQNEEKTVVEMDWDTEGEFQMFGDLVVFTTPGRNYKAIAEKNGRAIADFEHAAKRHKMIDEIVKRGTTPK